jgi:hypothetical protein
MVAGVRLNLHFYDAWPYQTYQSANDSYIRLKSEKAKSISVVTMLLLYTTQNNRKKNLHIY